MADKKSQKNTKKCEMIHVLAKFGITPVNASRSTVKTVQKQHAEYAAINIIHFLSSALLVPCPCGQS